MVELIISCEHNGYGFDVYPRNGGCQQTIWHGSSQARVGRNRVIRLAKSVELLSTRTFAPLRLETAFSIMHRHDQSVISLEIYACTYRRSAFGPVDTDLKVRAVLWRYAVMDVFIYFACNVEIHRRLLLPACVATNPTPVFSASFDIAEPKSEEIARQYSYVVVSGAQAKVCGQFDIAMTGGLGWCGHLLSHTRGRAEP